MTGRLSRDSVGGLPAAAGEDLNWPRCCGLGAGEDSLLELLNACTPPLSRPPLSRGDFETLTAGVLGAGLEGAATAGFAAGPAASAAACRRAARRAAHHARRACCACRRRSRQGAACRWISDGPRSLQAQRGGHRRGEGRDPGGPRQGASQCHPRRTRRTRRTHGAHAPHAIHQRDA